MKVSWQVTGIGKDPWANAHRVEVEEDKPDKERGHYIYPDLYGQPADREIIACTAPIKSAGAGEDQIIWADVPLKSEKRTKTLV